MLTEVHVPVEDGSLKLRDPLFAPQGEARLFRLEASVPGLAFTAVAETEGDGYPLRRSSKSWPPTGPDGTLNGIGMTMW